ncbi:FecR family protein [Variovorax sp. 54]|uniref:FecR domain-containing protein n=1 Tax=Variovorax sp. 54 TaxID=2035212 RepID=UPI000C48514B|nr:FecR domain-containing protein [Variovorax sp. 54]PIF77712.1 FecR family protein [Variovorax sp. 54]
MRMHNAVPGEALLGEAADWLMRFQSGDRSDTAHRAFEQWRAQSPAHAAAWQRAESVLATFGQVPGEIGHRTLQGLGKPRRRQMLQAFGMLAIAAPTAWLAWRELPWSNWSADLRTAIGEQKSLRLADGTQLVLNTASAVNVVFTGTERRLWLESGEILITTAPDPAPVHRPFIVQTPQGAARALGTRFSVRRDGEHTRVAVFEGAVDIQSVNASRNAVVQAGSQASFSIDGVQPVEPAEISSMLWERGMFIARDMRLADLIAELGRYRTGVLRCHADVAGMRVSGAFPLKDTDESLKLLEKTLPLRIRSATRYWVSVEAR